jgi:beta-glucosidase
MLMLLTFSRTLRVSEHTTYCKQVEGDVKAGGRTDSVWDVFARNPSNIKDGSNADVAADFYHK